ncbi:hypothetical protein SAY87_022384 [Trapa incisa]|uniref:Bet v I/Major latex protein domain-containing protein n=1 Tax=Trapa incisa TaxID=236973 RepID=A0AAN7K0X0_9MYRT|nr:hypothetical protein SAY87_022384 [Trapa incisa]
MISSGFCHGCVKFHLKVKTEEERNNNVVPIVVLAIPSYHMGVVTKDIELISTVPPAKMFQAFCLDTDELFPKVLPQAFKSIELVEGDGGAGSIKHITFAESRCPNFAESSWIEGDVLLNIFEKVSYEIKFEAHHGGSVCKIKVKFFVVGDVQLDENELEEGKEKFVGLFRAVEGYVLANP